MHLVRSDITLLLSVTVYVLGLAECCNKLLNVSSMNVIFLTSFGSWVIESVTLGTLQKNKNSSFCNAKLAIIFTNSTYLFIMYIICDSLFKLKGT